jgi:hypothetical protein
MWKMPRCKIVSIMYIMFENFSKFFAEKKNIHIFIAALVILSGIIFLKRVGLYEGMKDSSTADSSTTDSLPAEIKKTPGSVRQQ